MHVVQWATNTECRRTAIDIHFSFFDSIIDIFFSIPIISIRFWRTALIVNFYMFHAIVLLLGSLDYHNTKSWSWKFPQHFLIEYLTFYSGLWRINHAYWLQMLLIGYISWSPVVTITPGRTAPLARVPVMTVSASSEVCRHKLCHRPVGGKICSDLILLKKQLGGGGGGGGANNSEFGGVGVSGNPGSF